MKSSRLVCFWEPTSRPRSPCGARGVSERTIQFSRTEPGGWAVRFGDANLSCWTEVRQPDFGIFRPVSHEPSSGMEPPVFHSAAVCPTAEALPASFPAWLRSRRPWVARGFSTGCPKCAASHRKLTVAERRGVSGAAEHTRSKPRVKTFFSDARAGAFLTRGSEISGRNPSPSPRPSTRSCRAPARG